MDNDEQAIEQDEPEAEPKAEPKAKPPDPRLPVRLIGQKDGSALVEWLDEEGQYRRAYVPSGKVQDDTVASKELAKGIPYGLPWENWIEVTATPQRIANELRRQGVWCWPDLNHAVLSAANRAFDAGDFLRRVDQEVRK